MNSVVMYQPICRDLLEDLFQSAIIAQSFKDLGNGSYQINLPDKDLPRLRRFQVTFTIARCIDLEKVKAKLKKFGS